jgi:hypothetical protein
VYEKNNQFLYSFKKDLYVKNYNYGSKNYKLCTNNLGAIDDCVKKNINIKKIDYVFIGDSFVEGLGIEFEKTFFGLLKKKYPNKQFLNLGVSGYSTSIYYNKLKYFYNEGYNFKEVYIFLDTSDIFDEIYRYKKNANDEVSYNLTNNQINNLLDSKKKILKNIHGKFPGTFILLSLAINSLKNFSVIENYYIKLMTNHNFGRWVYIENNLYSKNNVEISLRKNSYFLEKIIKMAKNNRSKINIVLYPWPGQIHNKKINNKYNTYWTNFLKDKDVNLINLNSKFFNLLNNYNSKEIILKHYILGDIHFNSHGHRLIFDSIDLNFSNNK